MFVITVTEAAPGAQATGTSASSSTSATTTTSAGELSPTVIAVPIPDGMGNYVVYACAQPGNAVYAYDNALNLVRLDVNTTATVPPLFISSGVTQTIVVYKKTCVQVSDTIGVFIDIGQQLATRFETLTTSGSRTTSTTKITQDQVSRMSCVQAPMPSQNSPPLANCFYVSNQAFKHGDVSISSTGPSWGGWSTHNVGYQPLSNTGSPLCFSARSKRVCLMMSLSSGTLGVMDVTTIPSPSAPTANFPWTNVPFTETTDTQNFGSFFIGVGVPADAPTSIKFDIRLYAYDSVSKKMQYMERVGTEWKGWKEVPKAWLITGLPTHVIAQVIGGKLYMDHMIPSMTAGKPSIFIRHIYA